MKYLIDNGLFRIILNNMINVMFSRLTDRFFQQIFDIFTSCQAVPKY